MAATKRKNKTDSTPPTPSKPPKATAAKVEEDSSDGQESEAEDGDEEIPVKVNNASLSELKNALDDSTKLYLNKQAGFIQDFKHEDIKLSLGWLSSLVAAAISLAGWYLGWEKTQAYTGYCVAVYALLSVVMAIHATVVEKQIIYVGSRPSKKNGIEKENITISTDVKSYEPIYRIELKVGIEKKNNNTINKKRDLNLESPFKQYFDIEGTLDEPGWHSYLSKTLNDVFSKLQ